MNKVVILDGNNVCYRSLVNRGNRILSGHAVASGAIEKEISEMVIYGCLNTILNMAKEFHTNRIVVAWDSPVNIRKEKYPFYKSQKRYERANKDFNPVTGREYLKIGYRTFDFLREKALPYIGINNQLYQKGYEADDLIAQLVQTYVDTDFVVVSNDKDLFQLLDYCDINRYGPLVTRESFIEEYGIEPSLWHKVRALSGDWSDCIDGIPSIGISRAIDYLNGKMKPNSVLRSRIVSKEGRDTYECNQWLMKLPLAGTMPIRLVPDTLNLDKFLSFANKYGFDPFLMGAKLQEWKLFFKNAL